MFLLRFLSTLILVKLANAGHADMFSCRKGKCPVAEITDSNFDIELASVPTFMMFYAPWCGHCKQLAPVLKKAAKTLEQSGVKVGAVDVEPNPGVQGKFPDIRGFPTLKFLPSSNPKKAIDYQGGRDEASIVDFAKAQAKKHGVVLGEPVALKKHSELYSFVGRSALENKPVMLVIGQEESETPNWIGKLALEIRKNNKQSNDKEDKKKVSPELKTTELLKEASKTTKLDTVKDGIASLLELIHSSESNSKSQLSPSQLTSVYSNDKETIKSFQLTENELPCLILASIDRKTGSGTYVKYSKPIPSKQNGKLNILNELSDFIQTLLPIAILGPDRLKNDIDHNHMTPLSLPEFPKPANVLAAEEREKKKKEKELTIHKISNQELLNQHCYELSTKTCVLLFLQDDSEINHEMNDMVKKFIKNGFIFSSILLNDNQSLLKKFNLEEDMNENVLLVVKTGKRPRITSVSGSIDHMSNHLDKVIGGSATFTKLKNGLPQWPDHEMDKEEL